MTVDALRDTCVPEWRTHVFHADIVLDNADRQISQLPSAIGRLIPSGLRKAFAGRNSSVTPGEGIRRHPAYNGKCAGRVPHAALFASSTSHLHPKPGATECGTMKQVHRVGIIGGSGLYELEGFTNQKWVKVATPFGAPSDSFLTGHLAGRDVVFLPRHARGHRLLPSELNHRANIWAMKKLGVAWIVSVSAVGSLQGQYKPCDVVLPNQFVDRTKKSSEHTFFGNGIVAHIAFADPICEDLRQLLLLTCRKVGASVHDGGTYVNMEGPAFSTRAESTANHQWGFDVIGMTNLGEAKCAREAEIAYATMAMVTDYDAWKTDEEHVTVEMVIENLKNNAAQAQRIIVETIPLIPTTANWGCHDALRNAIMTHRSHWPADAVKKLKPLLAKYL